MSEQLLSGGGPTSDPALICPWCSAALPSAGEERCPSCGAALQGGDASEVPGVTRVDVEALLKGRAPTTQRPRGLIGWLSGEYEAAAPDAPPPGTLEPPDEAVRREMLRLELAALEVEVLARQAEAVAEAATESGEPVVLEDVSQGEGSSDAGATADDADAAPGDADAAPGDADATAGGDAVADAGSGEADDDAGGPGPEPGEG